MRIKTPKMGAARGELLRCACFLPVVALRGMGIAEKKKVEAVMFFGKLFSESGFYGPVFFCSIFANFKKKMKLDCCCFVFGGQAAL